MMLTKHFGGNVYQLQNSLTPINLVHLSLFSIPYKMYSPCNVSCVFGILTILVHTHKRLTIQYNQKIFLWNYV